ncbi:MAG: hypothetical protein IJ801_00945 [Lachnospiraceae bacterium]|nr:hypothetical protein [Lachnospiraceae bacterium]
MSSSLYKYETEAERLDRLKRLKMEGIKKQLRAAKFFVEKQGDDSADLALHNSGNRENTYTFSDHAGKSDVIEAGEVADGADSASFSADGARRQKLDLSGYLELDRVFQDQETLRLQAILSRIEDRIPDSDQARAEYDRLVKNLNEIIHNRAFDMEDIIHMVEQRVTLYLENRNYDNSALDEDLLMDYKALCILLGEDEEVVPVEQLRSRVDRMMREYEEQPETEVIADMVNEALERLGMKADGYCVLDGQLEGELYSSGPDNRCKVFVSCNASGVMIEPVNFDEHADEDEVADAQRTVCQAERELIDEVGRSGIRLQKVYSKEHAPDQIATKSDLTLQEGAVQEAEDQLEKLREYNRRRKNRRKKTESRSLSL